MDFLYIAGPGLVAMIFAAFALGTDPKRPILRNMFFLATLAALLIVMDMSVTAVKAGDWFVCSSYFNASSNVTTNTLCQKSPALPNSLDNIYIVMIAVVWLTFIYVILQLLANGAELCWRAVFKSEGGLDDIG